MFKLVFGPKAFIVVSDPVVARRCGGRGALAGRRWPLPAIGIGRCGRPARTRISPVRCPPETPAFRPLPTTTTTATATAPRHRRRQVRHLLRDNAMNYDKGVLAEILEPIMGKGLIPADLETWKARAARRGVGGARGGVGAGWGRAVVVVCGVRVAERDWCGFERA